MDFTLINKAIVFATGKHNGQYRKGTQTPYILHPLEAGIIASSMTDDEKVVAAAILHDTIEDTDTTEKELTENFGAEVKDLVICESEDKQRDKPAIQTWRERKEVTINHLMNCDDDRIKIITLSDKLSNVRSMYRDYNMIGEKLWQRFNQKDPSMHKWYYVSILEACKSLQDYDAYKEYSDLCEKVFGKYN